jgi:hypothetical protein
MADRISDGRVVHVPRFKLETGLPKHPKSGDPEFDSVFEVLRFFLGDDGARHAINVKYDI